MVLDARRQREVITAQILERLQPLLIEVPVHPADPELSETPGIVSP
jgi:hypothetical protein